MSIPQEQLFAELVKRESRDDPYPVWRQIARHPVIELETGEFLVTGYDDCRMLFQDPRMSADPRRVRPQEREYADPPFALLDPPRHDLLRALAMRHFGPPARPGYVESLRAEVAALVDGHLDRLVGRTRFDLVDSLSHVLPVEVISAVTGMPLEDSDKLGEWSSLLVLEPEFLHLLDTDGSLAARQVDAAHHLLTYFTDLLAAKRRTPDDTMLSRLANDPDADRMGDADLLATANVLLVGGHETTSTLIGNAVVQLLRNGEALDAVQAEPQYVRPLVEETLRFDPPVQFRLRNALVDVEIAGTRIPEGAMLILGIAAANRDAGVFERPHRFDVRRPPRPHLSFGNGIHLCFGAPLGRLEAGIALDALTRRLRRPRLLEARYGLSPETRGPARILVEVDEVLEAAGSAAGTTR